MPASVTVEQVERVAELANLELAPEEKASMAADLTAILDYIAQLNQLDTSGVAPLAQTTELAQSGADDLRADRAQPSLDRPEVMAQAPESDGAFFKVPKVIER